MIYLDATVFLHAALDLGTKGERARGLLKNIEAGTEKAATSILTFDEVAWNVRKERGFKSSMPAAKSFLEMPNLNFIDANIEVVLKAYNIMKEYRLAPRDAIHAASAIIKGIGIIISEDSDFDDIKELKRKSL